MVSAVKPHPTEISTWIITYTTQVLGFVPYSFDYTVTVTGTPDWGVTTVVKAPGGIVIHDKWAFAPHKVDKDTLTLTEECTVTGPQLATWIAGRGLDRSHEALMDRLVERFFT